MKTLSYCKLSRRHCRGLANRFPPNVDSRLPLLQASDCTLPSIPQVDCAVTENFLLLGMLAGSEGIGGIAFENYELAHGIGTLGLAMILFDGGLRTQFSAISTAWKPSIVLATVGVLITEGEIRQLCSVSIESDESLTLDQVLRKRVDRSLPATNQSADFGPLRFTIREVADDGSIAMVGMKVLPNPMPSPPIADTLTDIARPVDAKTDSDH